MAKRPKMSGSGVKRPAALSEYRKKRDFSVSPEPPPKVAPAKAAATSTLRFCIQKHLASSLHYDFRLEHNGVLLSWAVPRGPSFDPRDKRLAVHVEDHPLGYGHFEGVIPSGYGAGVVMLWDEGTWTPEQDNVDKALEKGDLKFTVDGVKIKGSWVLVRTTQQLGKQESWLLIKHRDKWAGQLDVVSIAPQSVKSFGDLSDILRKAGIPPAWLKMPPVKSGETAELFRETIRQALKSPATHSEAPTLMTKVKGLKTKTAPKVAKAALTVGSKRPNLTNQSKVLYPATGFTKGQLVDYYTRVAPLILPHLAGRAITFKRYPDGVDAQPFFEKRCPSHRPDWVKTVTVDTKKGSGVYIDYCLIEDVSTLIWAANLAAIELHVPLALAKDPDTATSMVFDLDPGPGADLKDCSRVALRLRAMLSGAGLECLCKLSGGKGIHLYVPLNSKGITFDDTRAFSKAAAMALAKDDPKRVTATMAKSERPNRVYVDWAQNDRAKTTVGVYSVRARAKPFVSMPLSWEQIEAGELDVPTADLLLPKTDGMIELLTFKQALPKL